MCILSMACSRCVRAVFTAEDTGTSMSGGASRKSSSSSGMVVAGGAER